jgi:hypothetical protein
MRFHPLDNDIGAEYDEMGHQRKPDGAESLAGVLAQCPGLAHLNLSNCQINDSDGIMFLVEGLEKCAALTHFNLRDP